MPAGSGTLSITHNGTTNAVIAGTTTMAAGDALTWMPASDAQGQINALSVKAFDGDALAANATKIFISTSPKAVVSAKAIKGSALETKAGTHAGDGKILISRVGGDLTLPLDVTLSVSGTADQGVNYNLLAPDGATILAELLRRWWHIPGRAGGGNGIRDTAPGQRNGSDADHNRDSGA